MSSVRINGALVCSTPDFPSVTAAPSFATHRLVDGHWVPKTAPGMISPTTSCPPARPIGFQPAPISPATQVTYLGSRKEYLRAIEVAAGHCLLKGTDSEAIDAIRRGRLGGRKDNMGELHQLLTRYTKGVVS